MRHIDIKISFNDIKSKLPGNIPSLVDFWEIPQLYKCGTKTNKEKFYNFDSALKKAREYNINSAEITHGVEFASFNKNSLSEFTSGNYGLIPSDIIIPSGISSSITDYTDFYVNIPNKSGGFYDLSWPEDETKPHYEGRKIVSSNTNTNTDVEVKVLTYNTLNKWYVFFKNYYGLIKNIGYELKYLNALDYYEHEIEVKNDDLKHYYEEIDKTFAARGGDEMYKWITNNCIIQYNIPEKFINEWGVSFIYLPEAIKWYYWFKERIEKYSGITEKEDCNNVDDCYDCEKFIKLGGESFYNDLDKWLAGLDINTSFATMSASITIPLNITNSIDDLGEMSIFSNEWDKDEDYHNTLSDNAGTVTYKPYYRDNEYDKVYYNDSFIIKSSVTTGHHYDESIRENVFKNDDWDVYTNYYINENPDKFAVYNSVSSYTYSPLNGRVIYNPKEEDIRRDFPIVKTNAVCVNGITHDIIDGKYVEMCYDESYIADLSYKQNKKLQIFKDGKKEYAVLNGKRKYVEPNEERIYFLKGYNCEDEGCEVKSGKYIVLDGELYLVDDSNNTIEFEDGNITMVYPILDGYFSMNENIFYISGDTVVVQNGYDFDERNNTYIHKFRELNQDELNSFGIKRMSVDENYVTVYYVYNETICTVISGKTDSKLELLRRKEITTDDLGNELPGHFRSVVDINNKDKNQSNYNVPYDGCVLDILYKVGEVSNLTPNESITPGNNNSKYFDGNIITNIEFYYKDKCGDKKYVELANKDDALLAIEKCKNAFDESGETDNVIDDMLCDITYYFGAVIEKKNKVYKLAENYYKGIKYIDTVHVSKNIGTYYLNYDKCFTFNYYLLSQDKKDVHVDDLNRNVVSDSSTYFEMNLYFYRFKNNKVELNDSKIFNNTMFDNNNGTVVLPVFRNEFNLGSSLPQNIDANIYIDRGVNAAYEKHLKLQEIRTMEALENMGNNYFKINEY